MPTEPSMRVSTTDQKGHCQQPAVEVYNENDLSSGIGGPVPSTGNGSELFVARRGIQRAS